jgi:hypothetical protein
MIINGEVGRKGEERHEEFQGTSQYLLGRDMENHKSHCLGHNLYSVIIFQIKITFRVCHAFYYLCNLGKNRGKKVKLSLCLTNQALRHDGVWGSGCIDPHFLDLGTSWR